MKLVEVKEWCDTCGDNTVAEVLIDDDGSVLGFFCYTCGEQELERIRERRKPTARCLHNINSNRRCLLNDKHTGGHDLPCVEASAHGPHAKGGAAADGKLYQCSGHRFDRT